MASWKKIITSGSNAQLRDLKLSGNITSSFDYRSRMMFEYSTGSLMTGIRQQTYNWDIDSFENNQLRDLGNNQLLDAHTTVFDFRQQNVYGTASIGFNSEDGGLARPYMYYSQYRNRSTVVSPYNIGITSGSNYAVGLYLDHYNLSGSTSFVIIDSRPTNQRYGLRYYEEYSSSFVAKSLVNKSYVQRLITGSKFGGIYGGNGIVANNTSASIGGTKFLFSNSAVGGHGNFIGFTRDSQNSYAGMSYDSADTGEDQFSAVIAGDTGISNIILRAAQATITMYHSASNSYSGIDSYGTHLYVNSTNRIELAITHATGSNLTIANKSISLRTGNSTGFISTTGSLSVSGSLKVRAIKSRFTGSLLISNQTSGLNSGSKNLNVRGTSWFQPTAEDIDQFTVYGAANGEYLLRIDTDPFQALLVPKYGNVGISTYSPRAILHVSKSNNNHDGLFLVGSSNNRALLSISSSRRIYSNSNWNITGSLQLTGSLNTTGSDSYINGIRIGRGTSRKTGSLALGWLALRAPSNSGRDNIAVGYRSLYSNTTGHTNITIGNNAMAVNLSGYENISIGHNNLSTFASGYSNVIVGSNIGYGMNNSIGNTLSGYAAFGGATGNYNVCAGYATMQTSTTSTGNTTYGAYSLYTSNNGNYNTALGLFAGYWSYGQGNIYIGHYAGPPQSTAQSGVLYIASGSGRPALFGNLDTKKIAVNYTGSSAGILSKQFTVNGTSEFIGTQYVTGSVNISGTLTAAVKSFDIPHPTKSDKRLVYGVLEGPEHAVYTRGVLTGTNVIHLPEVWTGLVDENTITVQLTPNGFYQQLYVAGINDNKIFINDITEQNMNIDCFYFVQATRKDVPKLITEQ